MSIAPDAAPIVGPAGGGWQDLHTRGKEALAPAAFKAGKSSAAALPARLNFESNNEGQVRLQKQPRQRSTSSSSSSSSNTTNCSKELQETNRNPAKRPKRKKAAT